MKLDFTHRGLAIQDIKKIKNEKADFYKIKFAEIDTIVSVSGGLLDMRLCSHFIKESVNYISRNDILSCKYNVNITEGMYYRLVNGTLVEYQGFGKNKYINFIDIQSEINEIEKPFFSKYTIVKDTPLYV